MIAQAQLTAFLATTDAAKAKAFYQDTLQLSLVEETPHSLVFDSNGSRVRIQVVQTAFTPHPFTALGWKVPDVHAMVSRLRAAGVEPERFGGDPPVDEHGVWTPAPGIFVAWIKDLDGNILSFANA